MFGNFVPHCVRSNLRGVISLNTKRQTEMLYVKSPITQDMFNQGFIQDFELGGKQDGSRMVVVCETHACLLGGSGSMPPRKLYGSLIGHVYSHTASLLTHPHTGLLLQEEASAPRRGVAQDQAREV